MSKIAMVTGASGGIGCACALALLAEGWQVILVGRREDALRTTADAAGSARAAAHVAPADVSDPAAVTRLFADVRREHGRLDLLFNNAGIFTPSVPPDQTTLDDWHRSVAETIPLERWGTPEDVAGAAVYLASDAARYVTGQMIMVNGGDVM